MATRTLTVLVVGRAGAPHLRLLDRLPSQTAVTISADEATLAEVGARADVVVSDCGYGRQLASVWPHLRAVRWVHSVTAGIDHLLFPALVESHVVLTNGRGAFKRALAEFVLTGCLHFAKDLPRLERQRRARRWETYDMEELHGRTLGIVGYGEIGHATALLAQAFGLQVLALRRRPELSAGETLADELIPPERLHDLLRRSDYVLLAAPLTAATRGMIGAAELAVMKPTAVLINVGRGPLVVEDALVAALGAGRLRGAVLDVFDTEPLPADHALYGLDNVLFSPHTADRVTGWLENAVEVFLTNFERFRKGEPLLNVVDKRAGY